MRGGKAAAALAHSRSQTSPSSFRSHCDFCLRISSLDDDEEETTDVFFPAGSPSASGAFPSNALLLLMRLRSTDDDPDERALLTAQQMHSCALRLRVDKLVATPTSSTAAAPEQQTLVVKLAPRAAATTAGRGRQSRRARRGSPDAVAVTWASPLRTQRWIMPSHMGRANRTDGSSERSALPAKAHATCASLREQQRLVFLENGVSSVGAILGPIVSTMMAPVIEQFEQTSTVQVAQQVSKNYVSSLTGSIPPEVANAVSQSLSTGVTDMVVDLVR